MHNQLWNLRRTNLRQFLQRAFVQKEKEKTSPFSSSASPSSSASLSVSVSVSAFSGSELRFKGRRGNSRRISNPFWSLLSRLLFNMSVIINLRLACRAEISLRSPPIWKLSQIPATLVSSRESIFRVIFGQGWVEFLLICVQPTGVRTRRKFSGY